jgi:ABC-type molybdate transport system permease subunit
VARARSRAQGVAKVAGSSRVETFVAFVRAPMQKRGVSFAGIFAFCLAFGRAIT